VIRARMEELLQIPRKSPADSEMMSPGWRAPCWQ
jgi:hypothetical protein